MNITKHKLAEKISNKAQISSDDAVKLIEMMMNLIKKNSKKTSVKISNFGTFKKKLTIPRIGRNPKNMQTFKIPSVNKIVFSAAKATRGVLN